MLQTLLNEAALEELAGERAFDRGVDYFADGHVTGLKEKDGAITALVRGTYDYRVKLWAEDDELAFECSCPVGQSGDFCKHCVAVGLAWLDHGKQKRGACRGQNKGELTDEEIRAYLVAQDKGALVDLMLEYSECHPDFHDHLLLIAAERGTNGPDIAAFRTAIDKAIRRRGFVDYSRMPVYARGIEAVIDSLEALLKRGHAKTARELVERALQRMESAMNEVDDSDGHMGGIFDRLQQLHLGACQVEKPDPVALARFLFEWEVSSGWEIFIGAAETYADVLGKAGLVEYRKRAEAKWAKVPPLLPRESDPEQYRGRWRITHMMEALAKQAGDMEALVAVKSRDLSQAFHFLEIAQLYKAAANREAAMQWAERGLQAFPEHTDGRLREFLIEEYHGQKRHSEAIAIAWTSFRERSGLDSYVILHKSACQAKQWPEWREKALALLRADLAARDKREAKIGWGRPLRSDHSELVSIYLWEGNSDSAWAEAKNSGCHNGLWFRLAEAREKDHPDDALEVYAAQLRRALQPAEPRAYREAVEILRRIHKLKAQIGKGPEFVTLIQSIRVQHKARRNLMKLLDAEGW